MTPQEIIQAGRDFLAKFAMGAPGYTYHPSVKETSRVTATIYSNSELLVCRHAKRVGKLQLFLGKPGRLDGNELPEIGNFRIFLGEEGLEHGRHVSLAAWVDDQHRIKVAKSGFGTSSEPLAFVDSDDTFRFMRALYCVDREWTEFFEKKLVPEEIERRKRKAEFHAKNFNMFRQAVEEAAKDDAL